MRTALFLLVSVLALGDALGQTVYNYDNPDFRSSPGYLHVTADSSVFMTGMSSNDFMYGSAGVYRSVFDEDNVIQYTDQLPGFWGEFPEEMAIYGMNNGDFIIAARLTGCDYGQPITVGIFDQYGTPHFEPFDVALNYYVEPKISLVGGSIGESDTIVAISDPVNTFLMTYDGANNLIVEEVLSYTDQIELKDGFLSAKENLLQLQDEKFNTITSKSLPQDIVKVDTMTSGYTVLTTDSLYVLDGDMQIVHRRAPDSSYALIFATSHHIWGFQSNGFIGRYGHDLIYDTTYSLPFPAKITDAKHVGDIIHIAGQYHTPYELSRFHVKTTADAFLKGELPDISLVKISIPDTVRTRPRPWGPVNFLDIEYGRVYVTLHNSGNVPIDNVDVKMRQQHCPGICSGAYELTYTLKGLNLDPGQTREYFLDDLTFQCAAFAPDQLCMWVVAPNRMPDLNPVEVPICGEIEFLTGTRPILVDAQINIWPNPTRGTVIIDTDLRLAHYEIVNSIGQIIASAPFTSEQYQVEMTGLPNGSYFIYVEDHAGNYAAERIMLMR